MRWRVLFKHFTRLEPLGLLVVVVLGIGVVWAAVVVGTLLIGAACDPRVRDTPVSRWPLESRSCLERTRVKYAVSRDGQSLEVGTVCDDQVVVASCT